MYDRYILVSDPKFIMPGFNNEGKEIITLKLKPMYGELLRNQYKCITPVYYMNKQHWNSIYVDGNVSDDLLKELIEKSNELILNSLSKKMQKEILEIMI